MEIRQAKLADVPSIMRIYEKARVFMENSGNPTQWAVGYPGQQLVEKDIIEKNCYICEEQGKVVGVFSFIVGEDPTYQKIEHGEQYTDLHQMDRQRGLQKFVLIFAKQNAVILGLTRIRITNQCRRQS